MGKIIENLKQELTFLIEGIKKTRKIKITKASLIKELTCNGIAALVAFLFYSFLSNLFNVKTKVGLFIKHKIRHDHSIFDIDRSSFEIIKDWIGTPVIFIISILLFTYIEQVLEKYFEARSKGIN